MVSSPPPAIDPDVELPPEAGLVSLPRATVRSDEASPTATRWVMGVMWFVLIALVLLCAIGPHIPAGE